MRKRSANVAAATINVLSARKRSVSGKCFICAKVQRQQQQMFYLRESEAAATTNVLSARKRSVSGKCFICAKAKRQQQSAQSERKSNPSFAKERYFF
ncbi:hypothetical protein [Lysinibacillus sp. RS5]|uniref:hypothetical protein n=1 Tax=unclassified Lysinibacillus TaxID=2636778 RepID=UPI0035BE51B3